MVSTGINRFIWISTSQGGQTPHRATIRWGHRCGSHLDAAGRSGHRYTPCSNGGRHSQGREGRSPGSAAQGLPQNRRCTRRGCSGRWSCWESNRSGAWCQGVKCGFFGGDNARRGSAVSKWVEMGGSGVRFRNIFENVWVISQTHTSQHSHTPDSSSQGGFSKIL